jgi:hypothetical protein
MSGSQKPARESWLHSTGSCTRAALIDGNEPEHGHQFAVPGEDSLTVSWVGSLVPAQPDPVQWPPPQTR